MNKNIVFVFVLILGLFGAGIWGAMRHFATVDDPMTEQLELDRLQREYLERVPWIRSNPDEKTYRDEVQVFFKWYFDAADKYLTQYKGTGLDHYVASLEPHLTPSEAHSNKAKARLAEHKAFYDAEKSMLDLLRSGRYHPVWTGTDKGLRLDIISDDMVNVDGKPKIRFVVLVWGAQRELITDENKGLKHMKVNLDMSADWKLYDAKGKLYGEMTAGGPALRNDYPEKLIPIFPPMMVLGHYDLDLMPAQVQKVDMTFSLSSQAPSGGVAMDSFNWKIDCPSEWKLQKGQLWEGATESIRSEDEIDPTKAAAAAKEAN